MLDFTMLRLGNVGFLFTITLLGSCVADDCLLDEVQKCLGASNSLVPYIYLNPLDTTLLHEVKQNHCGTGLDGCLMLAKGNCSGTALAPYNTIVTTVNFVCRSDPADENHCILNPHLQDQFRLCFQLFKVVLDSTVSDTSLSRADVDRALCSAYYDVAMCCFDVLVYDDTCDAREQTYINGLLHMSTQANKKVLGC